LPRSSSLFTYTTLFRSIEDVAEPQLKIALVRDVRRLTSLVSAMLDLARLQNHAIEKRPIDLAVVTLDVLADFSPSALDAGIELSDRKSTRLNSSHQIIS